MTEACPNCGKPVLATDTVCWHCNYPLPKRPKARPPARPAARPRPGDAAAAETADYDLRALLIYGLLTLAVILALALVMRALSRQPLLVRSAGLARAGWVTMTDNELRYTLSLPAEWQWLDVSFRDRGELLADVTARQPYIERSLQPLGAAAGDVEILAVAIGTRNLDEAVPIPFVVVGRSPGLSDLQPQAALDRLAGGTLPVTETEIDTRLSGQPQARFNVLDLANAYQCRGLFVNDGAAGYLVSACAPQDDYSVLQRELDDILDSFQLLQN